MFFVVSLAVTGLFLIFLEFFLPKAIMAIGGTILLTASLIVFHFTYPAWLSLFIYFLTLLSAVYLVVKIGLVRGNDSLNQVEPLESYQACLYPKELVGKIGVTTSDLSPSGLVIINDRTFQAVAGVGFIEKGATIKVLGGESSRLIVGPHSE